MTRNSGLELLIWCICLLEYRKSTIQPNKKYQVSLGLILYLSTSTAQKILPKVSKDSFIAVLLTVNVLLNRIQFYLPLQSKISDSIFYI